jgi:hypothetical protein
MNLMSLILYRLVLCGSSRSLRPSPKRLNEKAVIKIARLGNTIKCGNVLIPCQPVLANVPQLDSGGAIPRPKKLRVDSASIA